MTSTGHDPAAGRSAGQPLPLSTAQLGIWYAQRINPTSPVYNTGRCVELAGKVDVDLLAEAIRRALAETDALNVRFDSTGEETHQIPVAPHTPVRTRVDLSSGPDPYNRAWEWMREDLARPLSLHDGELYRTAILHIGQQHVLWYLCCHHIATDAHAFSLIQQRTAQIYTALAQGEDTGHPLSALRTILDSESAYRCSPTFTDDRDFWLTRMENRPEPVSFSAMKAEPAPCPLRQSRHIPKDVTDSLTETSQLSKATWHEGLVAAIAAFLHRMTGTQAPALGIPCMARYGPRSLRVPVTTANILPMWVETRPGTTVSDLLSTTTQRLRELRAHQRYRGEELRRELGLLGKDRRWTGPLVNLKPPAPSLRFGELTGRTHYLSAGPVEDLTVTAYAEADGIQLDFDANPSLYTETSLRTLLEQFAGFLGVFSAQSDATVDSLPITNPDTPRKTTAAPETEHRTLVELFAVQAARAPEFTAVVSGTGKLTYRELDRASNRLAHRLIHDGVTPGTLVGVALPRSAELIVAILAVLKAGAAYLPLAPDYPAQRLGFMLTDARPVLLITTSDHAPRLPGDTPCLALDAPDVRAAVSLLPEEPPSTVSITASNPAYVIYTSGSTGTPKGVPVSHRNVVRLFTATRRWFDFGPHDVWTLFHSPAFDFSVWEIWGALAHGGRLVVVPSTVTRSPRDFLRLLVTEQVTVLNQTPSAFATLDAAEEDEPELGERLTLRFVVFGGEKLEPARLAGWFARHRDTSPTLVNMYGITETTVHVTYHRLTAEAVNRPGARSIIGVPIPDLRVYVLDSQGNPAPVGITGEIHVGGPGLSYGYLGKPALTAERFVPDPFGPPGARMYASGDLARWTSEGVLEYLGRADDQVKIRGFRIEPAEIVAAALRSGAVADAAVLAEESRTGDRRLVCYVVPAVGSTVDPHEIRAELADRLPGYLVPSLVVPLDQLPLTPNGKLDRAALNSTETLPHADRAPATTPIEQVLCGLFAEVTGVPSVGAHDSFFELGGHSLLATRLIGRVRQVLGSELDIRSVFTEPTPAQLARRLESSRRPPLLARGHAASAELSYAQRRLWFLHRMQGPTPLYNLPLSVELSGALDPVALRTALADVVRRHDGLRSVFPARQGVPQQKVLEAGDTDLSLVESSPDTIERDVAEAACRGFDLGNETPLRAVLFRLTPRSHVLLLCLHHIAGDDSSLPPLVTDLATAYTARTRGEPPRWSPLPVRYADYVRWQEELLGSEEDPDSLISRELAYWTKTLSGLPDRLDLATDRPRPATQSYRGDRVPIEIGPGLHNQLRTLAAEHGVSLFMVLHAALATLLHRLGAGSDIAVGTPVAGRTDDALNGLIGFFVNTLVLRTDLAGDPSFAELLSRVRETDLGAYAHQETPFDRLVEVLNPVRSPDRHPLFQVMLALGTSPADQRWGLELTAKTVPVHTGTEKFDFTVNLTTAEDELTGYVEYATDLFDAETATSFAERLTRILRSAVADPKQPVSRFTILGEAERNRIVHEWNATEAEISPLSLPEMIQRQVRETPDAVAMVYEGITLTYADLNRRANQLARMLRSLGVRPERTVGIHLPRNADQVVGLLAVLKAGGAFVPLDASWPAQRISDIAANAGLTAILSQDDLADTLPTLPIPVVNVDSVDCSAESTENLRISAGADNLAYVIYTSGSTGTPKGAMIPHRAISNRLPWQVDLLGLTPADAVLYKAPLTFDISVNEVFLPLVSGARLVVAAPGGERDTSYLLTLISSQKVTFIYLVSTMLELLLERPDIDEGARSLRHVWCGGEVLTPQLYERFRQHIDATMYHGYGPAETTIGVSCQVYRGQDPAHGITIGHPNPNNQVYVLDEHLNPVPIGVPGQLYIGGVQLARGYLGDPRRTAESFVPDPFSGRRGARLYATGDLGRLKRDGAIEFLGRADNQVKIRGMRLELEEIDAVLARHPKIRQAVVLARKDASGTPSLSAYCVPEKDVTAEELRQWLSTQLPDYMVPAEYTMLAAFPLMVSGKVDRKALEAIQPAATQHSTVDDWIPPQPGMQRVVADIWSTVLGVPRIGARDNFFDLGGHSLLLTRAQTALQRELGHGIPIVDLFTHATVETLAAYLEGERTSIGHALDVLLPLRPEGVRPAVFCVHPASGLAWPFAGMRQHIAPEYPLYGIQARGLHGEPGAAATSVDEMAGEYVRQIRSVQPEGPYRLLGWSFGGVVAHAMATLLQSAGQRVDLLGMLDSYPAYPWDKLASDHEQQALRSLLYMSHYDLNTLPEGPLDRRTVLGIVAEQGGVLSELDEATITAVMETFVRSAPLQQQAKHAVFQGDLLFFTATVNQIDSALSHKDWLPHVRGKIENIDIACEHKDMLQAGPTAIIGKAINARLRRLE